MFMEEIIFHRNVFLLSLRSSLPGMVWIKSCRIFVMKSISYWSSKHVAHSFSARGQEYLAYIAYIENACLGTDPGSKMSKKLKLLEKNLHKQI